MEIKFICKKCDWHILEEMLVDVEQWTEIDVISKDGAIDYTYSSTSENGTVQGYYCASCGLGVHDKDGNLIDNSRKLARVLKSDEFDMK